MHIKTIYSVCLIIFVTSSSLLCRAGGQYLLSAGGAALRGRHGAAARGGAGSQVPHPAGAHQEQGRPAAGPLPHYQGPLLP